MQLLCIYINQLLKHNINNNICLHNIKYINYKIIKRNKCKILKCKM